MATDPEATKARRIAQAQAVKATIIGVPLPPFRDTCDQQRLVSPQSEDRCYLHTDHSGPCAYTGPEGFTDKESLLARARYWYDESQRHAAYIQNSAEAVDDAKHALAREWARAQVAEAREQRLAMTITVHLMGGCGSPEPARVRMTELVDEIRAWQSPSDTMLSPDKITVALLDIAAPSEEAPTHE